LLELVRVERKGRTITFALNGSEELRYLDVMQANANVGGARLTDILLREDARLIEVWEEFLHGTQMKCEIIERFGLTEAEIKIKEFMVRHRRLIGISDDDAAILLELAKRLRRG
jgi:hypothetical protein